MNKFLIILTLFSNSIFSQENWKRVGKTEIFYSNFSSNRDNVLSGLKYEYFKKENSIIVVDWTNGEQFQKLFQQSPQTFEDIYNNAYSVFNFIENNEGFDSKEYVLKNYLDSKYVGNVYFDKVLFLLGRKVIRGVNEYIWFFCNGYPGELGGCFLNIVFENAKKKNGFVYKRIVRNHCEI